MTYYVVSISTEKKNTDDTYLTYRADHDAGD